MSDHPNDNGLIGHDFEHSSEPGAETTLPPFPDPILWRKLLSGSRSQVAGAVERIQADGQTDEYAALLLVARRRDAKQTRRWFGITTRTTAYTERERRSALTALGLLWGGLGRELAMALDPRVSHFDRERAHKSLIRRRDQRSVVPLIDALLSGHALEDWQAIPTLGALGDQRAVDALVSYIGLTGERAHIADSDLLDIGIEVGRALHNLKARDALQSARGACTSEIPHQRAGAALLIAGWGDSQSASLLAPLTADSDALVRTAVVMALGELKAPDTLSLLQTVTEDSDPQVSEAAERAARQVQQAEALNRTKKPGSKLTRPNPIRR